MIKSERKKIFNLIGQLVTLLAIFFVIYKIVNYSQSIDFSHLTMMSYAWISIFVFIYVIGNCILSMAWGDILAGLGCEIKAIDSFNIYGLSQIAKYLPGNIAHFGSRQLLGLNKGVSGKVLLKSTFWELSLLVLAGAIFSVFILATYANYIKVIEAGFLFFFLCLASFFTLKFRFNARYSRAFLMYLVFLTLSGIVFSSIFYVIDESIMQSFNMWLIFTTTFITAWLIGIVTPGAPGGIGIREAFLITLLGLLTPESELVFAVILSRGVTVCGDFLFFIIAWLSNNKRKQENC
mgnify:CR=1 FL=1|tara:strand:+ start:16351 stop:17229 length:879 start_codon:yes stop_codon:yes gene_type:complete